QRTSLRFRFKSSRDVQEEQNTRLAEASFLHRRFSLYETKEPFWTETADQTSEYEDVCPTRHSRPIYRDDHGRAIVRGGSTPAREAQEATAAGATRATERQAPAWSR